MTAIIIDMALNAAMACLLVVTIVYCFKLNKRIRVLQDSKNEFAKLIEQFDATIVKAQSSVDELQTAAFKVNEELNSRLDKANFLADDLAFMIEKGGKLADRMEGDMRSSPKTAASKPSSTAAASSQGSSRSATRRPEKLDNEKRASLDALMQKASSKRAEQGQAASSRRRRAGVTARPRSKAEQELYDALKTGNE